MPGTVHTPPSPDPVLTLIINLFFRNKTQGLYFENLIGWLIKSIAAGEKKGGGTLDHAHSPLSPRQSVIWYGTVRGTARALVHEAEPVHDSLCLN